MEQQRLIGIILLAFGILLLLILGFIKADIDEQGTFLCTVVAENPEMSMDECPAHQSDSSWLISLGFGLAFLVAAAGLFLFFVPIERRTGATVKKTALSSLDAEEKSIITLLQEAEGSLYQSDIVKGTDFSKVKVTRLLDRLETKGLIERKRRGMTNLVILK